MSLVTLLDQTDVVVQHGYSLDTGPLVTFVAFSLLSCPPNYLWQSWLESTFPGYTSPDDAGTVASIAKQPQVKAAIDAAAPTLQRIEETASPVLEKASAATTALADSEAVKNARRRASEGVDTVKAKAKELEARAGINQSPVAKPPTRSQTFSTPDGQAVEKKIDTTFAQPPASSNAKALSIKNTAIKFALDQTLGAAVNNALFIVGIAFLKGQSAETALSALQKVRAVSFACASTYLTDNCAGLLPPSVRRPETLAPRIDHQLHTCSSRTPYGLRRHHRCWLGCLFELDG